MSVLRQAQHERILEDYWTVRPEPVEGRFLLEVVVSFWVYILCCADGSYYTGHTDDLEKRIGQHQSGEIEGYTSSGLPVKLVFTEEFPSRAEALVCEQQIKGWSRKKKEALIRGDWGEIVHLSRKKSKMSVLRQRLS